MVESPRVQLEDPDVHALCIQWLIGVGLQIASPRRRVRGTLCSSGAGGSAAFASQAGHRRCLRLGHLHGLQAALPKRSDADCLKICCMKGFDMAIWEECEKATRSK
jgi:hypothetical protein